MSMGLNIKISIILKILLHCAESLSHSTKTWELKNKGEINRRKQGRDLALKMIFAAVKIHWSIYQELHPVNLCKIIFCTVWSVSGVWYSVRTYWGVNLGRKVSSVTPWDANSQEMHPSVRRGLNITMLSLIWLSWIRVHINGRIR